MELDFHDYLNRLASAEPTPGGGSAAALVGTLAAALVAMVARIAAASPRASDQRETCADLSVAADALRERFLDARRDDEDAYGAYVAARTLPKTTDDEKAARREAMQRALIGAAEAPLRAAELAAACAELAARARSIASSELESDIMCALRCARVVLETAITNVGVNHRYLTDTETVAAQASRLRASVERYSLAAGSFEASSTFVI